MKNPLFLVGVRLDGGIVVELQPGLEKCGPEHLARMLRSVAVSAEDAFGWNTGAVAASFAMSTAKIEP